jgi:hypothetical protein
MVVALAAVLLISTSANAALISRAGGQAYYDTVLDVTWLADANLADTNDFGVTGINANGSMNWGKANEWIAAMNTATYLGKSDWRLPTVGPLNGSSFNYSLGNNGSTDNGYNQSEQGTAYAGATGSEMAQMFYNTLNNKGWCDPLLSTVSTCVHPPGWNLTNNTGPFSNLQSGWYWSGTEYAPNTSYAWRFNFFDGNQNMGGSKASHVYSAWAVRSGDIAPVPVPGAIWLFGGAVGLLGYVRRSLN